MHHYEYLFHDQSHMNPKAEQHSSSQYWIITVCLWEEMINTTNMYTKLKSQLRQQQYFCLTVFIPLQLTYTCSEYINSTVIVYINFNFAQSSSPWITIIVADLHTKVVLYIGEKQLWVCVGIQPVLTFEHMNANSKSLSSNVSVACHPLFSEKENALEWFSFKELHFITSTANFLHLFKMVEMTFSSWNSISNKGFFGCPHSTHSKDHSVVALTWR